MRFNRNIYMRLYQIAFFMPDIPQNRSKRSFQAITAKAWGALNISRTPIDNTNSKDKHEARILREKIDNILFSVGRTEKEHDYKYSRAFMQITEFEILLFRVCYYIYENLSSLFSPYEKRFISRKQKKTKEKSDFENNTEEFFKSIPKDAISEDMVKEKSFEMFHSVRAASYFYCKFSPMYCLYGYSDAINQFKNEIPILKYIKEIVSNYFVNCPTGKKLYINNSLYGLVDSIITYSKCKEGVKKRRSRNEKKIWGWFLKKLYNNIIINCFKVSSHLSSEAKFSFSDYILQERSPSVSKKEIKRRDRISKTQKDRLSERRMQVKSHIKEIYKISRSKGMSIRKACGYYFKEHKSELKLININSQRTLENNCSKTEPNTQRSAFSNMAYICPNYSTTFKQEIKDICYDILQSDRSLKRKQRKETVR